MQSEQEQKPKVNKGKKVAVKTKKTASKAEGSKITASKDQLGQEPMKGFMLRAQHEFRAYITLVNAWPRKQGNSIQKREVPAEIIEQIARKYDMYQAKEFQVLFKKLWADLNVRDMMIKQVGTCSHH